MLKISEMARLAHTTRRTLIFYDEKGIFRPKTRDHNGYRYYDYNQLYDLTFILGLRKLGISLDDIQKMRKQDQQELSQAKLIEIQTQLKQKIHELTEIQSVVNQQLQHHQIEKPSLYQPFLHDEGPQTFWCSRQSVTCTEEEVAQLFSEFYQQFNQLAVLATNQSGFLTNLGVDHPAGYATASFRIIREITQQPHDLLLPVIQKPAGRYVAIRVENSLDGIQQGLTTLQQFCHHQHLVTTDYLWQINDDNQFVSNGASRLGTLKFLVTNS
ncbi:MerR family transcriptional regulator [Fructilactobacillus hinvesii]|uniref:MerR family transcriptional regulator n=1 Tax=Fructilactobacillus hinvesii TaxID=2940300 RepID=A0ABY5BT28_9LACO|nr:MerR family transcriptional regulator [Fructilactobacillus hinvesii]USS88282.1 MerR family transcriptional regulator [Fructilactobacillus hinvesii]